MKRFTAFCIAVAFVLAMWMPACAAPRQDPELPFTKDDIIKAYDDVMDQLGGVRPLSAAKEERQDSKYSDIYFYMLTPQLGVMLQLNKGGTHVTHAKAIGVEDGTAETKALIVMNNMAMLAAVTPTSNGNVRGAIGKELGLTGEFPAQGKHNEVTANDGDKRFKLSFANNGQYGLTFTFQAEESAAAAPATPPAPAKKTSPPPAKRQEAPKKQPKPAPEPSGLKEIRS